MKKFSQRMLKVLLTLCMFAGQFSSFAFTISAESEDTINYVSFGASNVNGYGLEGYLDSGVTADDKATENVYGYQRMPIGSYPYLIAEELNNVAGGTKNVGYDGDLSDMQPFTKVNVNQLAMSSMRVEELRFLLDETYNGDSYTDWRFYDVNNDGSDAEGDWFKKAEPTLDELRDVYANAITNADVITLDMGINNFGVYISHQVGTKYPETLDNLDPVLAAQYNEAKAYVKSLAAEHLGDAALLLDEMDQMIDALAYALVGYCLNFDVVMEKINELNPDATIVVVSIQNLLTGLSIELPGLDQTLPLGELFGAVINAANLYTAAVSSHSDEYFYADVRKDGRVEFFVDDLLAYNGDPATLTQNMIDCYDVYDDDLHAAKNINNMVTAFIAGQIESVLEDYQGILAIIYESGDKNVILESFLADGDTDFATAKPKLDAAVAASDITDVEKEACLDAMKTAYTGYLAAQPLYGKALTLGYDLLTEIFKAGVEEHTINFAALSSASKGAIEDALLGAIEETLTASLTKLVADPDYTFDMSVEYPGGFFEAIAEVAHVDAGLIKSIAAMGIRTGIGNSFYGHPTPNGHQQIKDIVWAAMENEVTGKEIVYEETKIILGKLTELVKEYGPEFVDGAYQYAQENGYIALLEAEIENLKVEIEAQLKNYIEETKPVMENELAKLEAKLAELESALVGLQAELEAKNAELETYVDEQAEAVYAQAVAEIENVIAQIEALNAAVEAQIDAVEAKIADVKASIAKVDAKVVALNNAVLALEDTAEALFNTVANANVTSVESAKATVEAAKNTVLAAIDLVNTAYAELGDEVAATVEVAKEVAPLAEGVYAFVSENFEAIVEAVNALPTKAETLVVEAIEAIVAETEDVIAELEAKANALAEEVTTELNSEMNKLNAQLEETLAAMDVACNEAVAELNVEIAKLEAELAKYETELETAGAVLAVVILAEIEVLEDDLLALNEQLVDATLEAKAEIEAKIIEVEAQIAAKQAEVETIVEEAKVEIEAKIAEVEAQIVAKQAEVEAKIVEVKVAYETKVAEIEAEIEAVKTEIETKVAEVKETVEAEVAFYKELAETKIAELEAKAEELKVQIEEELNYTVAVAELYFEIMVIILEAEVEEEINNLEALAEALYNYVVEEATKVYAQVEEIVAAFNAAYEGATTDDLALENHDDYVALGDASAVSSSYVDLFASEIEEEYGITLDTTNLANATHTIEDIYAVIAANAETIADAELVTLGYGNNAFATSAMDRVINALTTGEVVAYDWTALLGEEGAAYMAEALEAIHAEIIEAGMNTNIGFMVSMDTAIVLAIEAYAYETIAYTVNLPYAIAAIREVNPEAVVMIVGMYNPFNGTTLTYGDTSIELGEYVDYLVEAANLYGTGLCMLTQGAIYVEAPEAETAVSNQTLEVLPFVTQYLMGKVSFAPNATGHAYITAQMLEALNIELDYQLGDVNLDGKVQAVDAALAYRIANGQYQATKLQQLVADVTGDGKNQALDAALIYRYANKQLESFPAEN